ncbi:MAG: MBOAT family O-acyltransferase [Oscillospiraceae bacterium]
MIAAAASTGASLLIEKRHKRVFLVLALVLDLGSLAVFKYTGFVVENLNALFGASIPVPVIALPIGISFYTFQALSYTVDVWRGDVPAQRSFAKFLLYISLFPQLIAGPIVRYADVAGQIDARSFDAADAFYGATRFCIGLAKRSCWRCRGQGRRADPGRQCRLGDDRRAWLGIVLYTFEIYFDFSGYSDMAIGMGRIFGFKYPENFRLPYTSRSITEFWRRWHISLGSFFRDYVYIPLGGKEKHQLLNMAVVWALTGLWHGASWNFVLWGLYFFVILAAEKAIGEKRLRRIPTILRRVGTMLLVILGWNIFYFTDLTQLLQHFGLLFGLLGAGFSNAQTGIQLVNNLPLLLVCAIGATSVPQNLGNLFGGVCVQGGKRSGQIIYACVTFAFDAALLALSTIALVGSTYNAFLYFRF